MTEARRTPTHADPLMILAMDHRESFGRTLFAVEHDEPTGDQVAAMRQAKSLIYRGLVDASGRLPMGHAGVLVDERYGEAVIDAAHASGITLAVPIERSGREWFELEWGDDWLEHLRRVRRDYAKILVRDNPGFDAGQRKAQLSRLHTVCETLRDEGVPLLYELLVPATPEQLRSVGGDAHAYDRDVRPALVAQVIADNQEAGVEPAIWKVEGLETADAARSILAQIRTGGRTTDAIVLGRDAPTDRLDHWLDVAAPLHGFVGFAIGRSIWEDAIRDWRAGSATEDDVADRVGARYLAFAERWATSSSG